MLSSYTDKSVGYIVAPTVCPSRVHGRRYGREDGRRDRARVQAKVGGEHAATAEADQRGRGPPEGRQKRGQRQRPDARPSDGQGDEQFSDGRTGVRRRCQKSNVNVIVPILRTLYTWFD